MSTLEDLGFWEDISSDCLLTDDIWDKFQLSSLDLNEFDWIRGDFEDTKVEIETRSLDMKSDIEIRNHDCMWAGHCGSKEHSMDDFKNILVKPISYMFQPTPPVVTPAVNTQTPPTPTIPAATKQSPIAPGRSLLLKTQPQHQQQLYLQQQMQQQQQQQQQEVITSNTQVMETQTAVVNPAMPPFESPPNSDDEETQVLQYLQDYISECDLDDDDLVDYFKHFEGDIEDTKPTPKSMPVVQQQQVQQEQPKPAKHFDRSAKLSRFVNDHCYHKDKNASMMRMPETPSDSEEEIDVVSTDDKHTRTDGALPTNPTTRDRAHIQQTMATAITKNGIRTLVPHKSSVTTGSSDSQEDSPSKRRPDGRAMKRNRHHHRMPPSPYKKQRAAYHPANPVSSDSEQEPSEKRIEHNNMERQRRVDLRNAFEELRVLVPEVNKRERAPKVVILREAAVYCHKLTDVSDGMRRQVDEMRRQQKRLRMRLSQLRLSLAPSHR